LKSIEEKEKEKRKKKGAKREESFHCFCKEFTKEDMRGFRTISKYIEKKRYLKKKKRKENNTRTI